MERFGRGPGEGLSGLRKLSVTSPTEIDHFGS
jgi:hypothetical protein